MTESSAANRDYSNKVVPQTEVPTINFNSDGVIKPKVKLTQIVHSKKEVEASVPWKSPNYTINWLKARKPVDVLSQSILDLVELTYVIQGDSQQDVFVALPVNFIIWLKSELGMIDKEALLKQMMEEIRCFGNNKVIKTMESNTLCKFPVKAPMVTFKHLSALFADKATWTSLVDSYQEGITKRVLHGASSAWASIAEWALPELRDTEGRIRRVNIHSHLGKIIPISILEVVKVRYMLEWVLFASMLMDSVERSALQKKHHRNEGGLKGKIAGVGRLLKNTARTNATECSVFTNTLFQG